MSPAIGKSGRRGGLAKLWDGRPPGTGYVCSMVQVQRVLVYGVRSGKTTLARTLGTMTGLPWHSADDEIGWLPMWRERPADEQRALAQGIADQPAWILDTAYGRWMDLIVPRAHLVVALDYPRHVSLRRLLKRTVTRERVCNGNVESIRQASSADSIILWHFRSFERKRRRIAKMLDDPAGPTVVRLTSPKQTQQWVADVERHGLSLVRQR